MHPFDVATSHSSPSRVLLTAEQGDIRERATGRTSTADASTCHSRRLMSARAAFIFHASLQVWTGLKYDTAGVRDPELTLSEEFRFCWWGRHHAVRFPYAGGRTQTDVVVLPTRPWRR